MIAGICNEKGNVMGLMPHPERASEPILSPDQKKKQCRTDISIVKNFFIFLHKELI